MNTALNGVVDNVIAKATLYSVDCAELWSTKAVIGT